MEKTGKTVSQILKKYNVKKSRLYTLLGGDTLVRRDRKKGKHVRLKGTKQPPFLIADVDYFYVIGSGYKITKEGEKKLAAKYERLKKVKPTEQLQEIEPPQVVEN